MRNKLLIMAPYVLSIAAAAQTAPVRCGPALASAAPSALLPVLDNGSGRIFIRRQNVKVHLAEQSCDRWQPN